MNTDISMDMIEVDGEILFQWNFKCYPLLFTSGWSSSSSIFKTIEIYFSSIHFCFFSYYFFFNFAEVYEYHLRFWGFTNILLTALFYSLTVFT